MMKNAYIHYLDLTSVWRRWRRRRPMCVVEQKWRRPTCAHGRAVAATEETGSSDVDGGGGDR
jgi:hypothetical protein